MMKSEENINIYYRTGRNNIKSNENDDNENLFKKHLTLHLFAWGS